MTCEICNYNIHESHSAISENGYDVCDDGDCKEIAEQLPNKEELPLGLETYIVDCENGWRTRSALVITHNGGVLDIQKDGYEPEDVRFYRNLSWIPPMIEQAYRFGLRDAFENSKELSEGE